MSSIGALVRAIRPVQWSKNGLLFAGAVFSHTLTDPDVLWRSVLGFATFCLLSSAVYLMNDLRDLEADRLHPTKKKRPLASGDLGAATAKTAVGLILVVSISLSWILGPTFAYTALAFLLINIVYTFSVKQIVILDVIFIAAGFVLRAIAGVELIRPVVPDVGISPWLLVCTFFLALFLGFGKRRQEIVAHPEQAGNQRAVLRQYSVGLLDVLTTACAAITLLAYAIYTIWPTTVTKFDTERLLWTVPFVAYGIFRYLWLIQSENQGEDPSTVLVKDRPLLLDILFWGLAVVLILYVL